MKSKAGESNNTGSSSKGEPVFVVIGKFRRPHGIKGELVMTVLTDFPDLVQPGQTIYLGEGYTPYQVKSTRWHGGDLLVALEELPDRTAVEIFRNIMVYMKADEAPELPEGEFESVGGFIISILGKIPPTGEKINFNDLEMVIKSADDRKIDKVLITHKAPSNPAPEEDYH